MSMVTTTRGVVITTLRVESGATNWKVSIPTALPDEEVKRIEGRLEGDRSLGLHVETRTSDARIGRILLMGTFETGHADVKVLARVLENA